MRSFSLCVLVGISLSLNLNVAEAQTRVPVRLAPRAAARVLAAQEAPTAEEAAAVQTVPTPMPADAAEAAKPAEDPKKAQEKQQRLQKIKQLSFDRRPSTILRVWNEYERELIEKEKAEKERVEKEKAEKEKLAKEQAEKETDEPEKSEDEDMDSVEEDSKAEGDTAEKEGNTEDPSVDERDSEDTSEAEESEEKTEGTVADKEKDEPKEDGASLDENTKTAEDAKEGNEARAKKEGDKEKKSEVAEAEEKKEEEPKGPDFDQQLRDLQRDVTLSRWEQVKEFLSSLEEDEATAIYEQLLRSLASAPKNSPNPAAANDPQAAMQQAMQAQNQRGGQPEVNSISAEDLIAIANLAPKKLDDKLIRSLAGLVRVYLSNDYLIGDLTEVLKTEVEKPEEERPLTRQQAAQFLAAAGHTLEAKSFLPTIAEAVESKDYTGLILLSEYSVALYQKDRKIEDLEQAWTAVQEVLAAKEVERPEHEKALQRAVDLAPQVRDTLGSEWLSESFTGQPLRGIEILSTIGSLAATGLQAKAQVPKERLELLRLQTTAIEALVEAAPETASEWSDKLSILAQVWLREADVSYRFDTSTSRTPPVQRDIYGNIFYYNYPQQQPQNNRQPQPIAVNEILKTQPSKKWLQFVSEALQPQVTKALARLYLKVNEEDEAFPHIEKLASTHPKVAQDLANEFLRVWADNHDPNASRNRTNPYMYMYGFERRAEGIPLTRSKQERNLEELAALVKRLDALPIEEIDEDLLVRAFTTCHSSAEVYRIEAIAKVFGPLENLDPKTLASLAQRMRTNLVGLWRAPATQKDAKTNRQQRDIAMEVMRGYQVALATVAGGLHKDPENWSLMLAKASLEHDANDFRRTIAPDSEFIARQEDAFAGFQRAAELYAKTVGEIRQDQETTQPFEVWYYASLGACDPERLTSDKPKDAKQLELIREAILALPGEAAERHMGAFANKLFTRMSSVAPALKLRYVETGLEIVGDDERAEEARKVYDYYTDLVTEIKLETKIDGSDRVGHGKPFGVFVNIVHTTEIERESGGFRRYLQNQDQGNRYYYNYGRPLENYRDKFEERVVSAVGDQFDVMSVTFQSEDVNSRSLPRYGWRYTPYAYVLLKAKGPEIDKLPPFQLDLDFLDTSGYAVIPIASPALPIDASDSSAQPRPAANVSVTQTLDERQAEEGKLILEVKATAQGLVPQLDELVKVAPEGFEVTETEDEGLSVSHFDPDSPENVVLSERTWLITMEAKKDLANPPTTFEFGEPQLDHLHEVIYQRYNDADLARVEPKIALEERYAKTDLSRWLWIAAGTVAALLVIAGILVALLSGRKPTVQKDEFAVPERITPFTVLHLLERIEQHNGLDATGRQKLRESRNRIEQFYFDESEAAPPDLEEIAETFARQAQARATNGVS